MPVLFTVAIEGFALLHAPPAVALANVTDEPAHAEKVPVMAAGAAGTVFTVTNLVDAVVPQALVTL